MKLFETLSEREKMNIVKTNNFDNSYIAEKLKETLILLHDNIKAHHHACSIACGNYLINTPEEIARYCIEWAGEECEVVVL